MSSRHEQRLLASIPYDGAVTMADLVRLSGLSRPTVAGLLGRLRADGAVLCEPAVTSGGQGRPAQRWRRARPRGMFAAIALSRDAVRVRVANAEDRQAAVREQHLDVSLDVRGTLVCGHRLLRECLDDVGTGVESLTSVVLGLPCPVGDEDRPLARGILPDWVGARPVERLGDWLPGVRVTVENDANLAAVGELAAGAGQGRRDLIYLKLAPGVGAALVVAGRLYRGATGIAGELGHVQINDMGRPCVCGARGCLAMEMHAAALHGTGGEKGLLALADLFRRCDLGDSAARRILGHIGGLLGEQLGALANMLDPECVVIGTGDVPAHPSLLTGIRDGIRRSALPVVAGLPVLPSPLGVRAEMLGGLVLAQRNGA